MQKYVCTICGYVYDEAVEKVKFQDLPETWKCPLCSAPKSAFKAMAETGTAAPQSTSSADTRSDAKQVELHEDIGDMKKLSAGELSALCSSLAKGCEKQYLAEESGLYMQLADYFKSKMSIPDESTFPELLELVNNNLSAQITEADNEAESASDRGAKRVLTWNRKVTTMLGALIERYEKEGDAMLENTNVYVCGICGFIYIGDNPPAVCPICKVPSLKFVQIRKEA